MTTTVVVHLLAGAAGWRLLVQLLQQQLQHQGPLTWQQMLALRAHYQHQTTIAAAAAGLGGTGAGLWEAAARAAVRGSSSSSSSGAKGTSAFSGLWSSHASNTVESSATAAAAASSSLEKVDFRKLRARAMMAARDSPRFGPDGLPATEPTCSVVPKVALLPCMRAGYEHPGSLLPVAAGSGAVSTQQRPMGSKGEAVEVPASSGVSLTPQSVVGKREATAPSSKAVTAISAAAADTIAAAGSCSEHSNSHLANRPFGCSSGSHVMQSPPAGLCLSDISRGSALPSPTVTASRPISPSSKTRKSLGKAAQCLSPERMQQQSSRSRRDTDGTGGAFAAAAGGSGGGGGYSAGDFLHETEHLSPGAGWLVAPEGGELQQAGAVAWGRLHSQAVTAVAAAGYVVLTTSLDGYVKVRGVFAGGIPVHAVH